MQVTGDIDQHLVDRVDMDIFRGDIFQIDVVNLGAHLHIVGHAWRRDDEIQPKLRRNFELFVIAGAACQPVSGCALGAAEVDLLHLLQHLKQARAAGNAVGF